MTGRLEIDAKPEMSAGRTTAGRRSAITSKNHPNLKDVAEAFISQGIVSGRFQPGAKVDQDEVAGILGISRLPVREALIELAQKGFVVAVPRRGAFVAELGVDDVADHFKVLGMAFALASQRAAKNLSDDQLSDLKHLHDEITATSDQTSLEVLNRDFYQVINHSGSSARLLSILGFLQGALPGSYYLSAPAWSATEAIFREKMLRALEAHDPDAAAEKAREHLRECAKVTIDALHARGYWTTPPPGGDRDLETRSSQGA